MSIAEKALKPQEKDGAVGEQTARERTRRKRRNEK